MEEHVIGGNKKYLTNCFLLLIPIIVWNVVFAGKLPKVFQPDIFWNDVPSFIVFGENTSRIIVFALALFMPLSFATKIQRLGLAVYIIGMLLYFISWLMLMYAPDSKWSNSSLAFFAPAYTPLLWLMGISLIGDKLYFDWPYNRWLFIIVSIVFLAFHNAHTLIVYNRIY